MRLHGAASWRVADGPWQLLERKHAALLAWLWLEGPTPRPRLAALLWPGTREERARGNLRQRLSLLRQAWGDWVHDDAGVLTLAASVQVEPGEAPLLDTHDFDDCKAFARWLDGRRGDQLAERKRGWLQRAREAAQANRLDDALVAADQLLQSDRESEEAYRVLMEIYYLRGDRAAAVAAWDRCREMLRQLYGVMPSAATRQLGETLLAASEETGGSGPSATPALPPTVLRPPRLVGRADAQQALAAGWRDGHVLVVAGDAGLGKSRLLADWATTCGAHAMAAARPGDAVLPYASLSRLLLDAIDRFTPSLTQPDVLDAARLLPRLAVLAGAVSPPPLRTDYERTQALLALARLFGDCARRGCLAFVLDDLQFADAASLSALRVLAEPSPSASAPSSVGLRFAFGLRPDELSAEGTALLASLAATGRCRRIDLAPLAAQEAGELFASIGVAAADATLAQRLWRQVGGNPAFLLESLKLVLLRGAAPTDAPLPLPPSIEAVIAQRIAMLSPRARHVAQLAAIAGTGFNVPLAAAALACTPIELSEPLRELELRQLLYGRQFVHDVIAQVVAASVARPVADFMHRFVAEQLDAQGGDAATIAEHWAACEAWRQAGSAFLRAAAQAQARAMPAEHAALLDRAMAACERDPEAHDELFQALFERAAATEAPDQAVQRPRCAERLQALARTPMQRLQALHTRAGMLSSLGAAYDDAEVEAGIAEARELGLHDLALRMACAHSWRLASTDRSEAALALLRSFDGWIGGTEDADAKRRWRRALVMILGGGDQLVEAIAESRPAIDEYLEAHDWVNAVPMLSNLGLMYWWRGELAAAEASLLQARALRERAHGSGASLVVDTQLGMVLRDLGRRDEAAAMLERAISAWRALPDNVATRTDRVLTENHLAQLHIDGGEAERALALLSTESDGIGERFVLRRLMLRLRWQRRFAAPDATLIDALKAAIAACSHPLTRALAELELALALPPQAAATLCEQVFHSAPALQRPGMQGQAAAQAAAAHAAQADGRTKALTWARRAQALLAERPALDLAPDQLEALLAAARASASTRMRRRPSTA